MIYFVFAFTIWLKEPLIKRGSQVWGGVKYFWAVTVSILINRKDVVTLLEIYRPLIVVFFMVLRKTDQRQRKMILSEE